MSHLLWKYYWENDVERFRRLLASAGPNGHPVSKSPAVGSGGHHLSAATAAGGASPRPAAKSRKTSSYNHHPTAAGRAKDANAAIGKSDINSRDHAGLTILLRAASSVNPNAIDFVQALIDHPAIDLYAQDPESGWNALHRCLYNGNISIARLLLAKERADLTSHTAVGAIGRVGQLIKTKDHEGNSPFDLYNSSIAARSLRQSQDGEANDDSSESSEPSGDLAELISLKLQLSRPSVRGDELFVFGSNKNLSLGVGDEDDRQYPERIILQRPDCLLRYLHEKVLEERDQEPPAADFPLDQIPTLQRNVPLIIQNVLMSKFHTAVLTDDPISNLYVSGVGRGGRLGLGDENTQFKFVPVLGPLAEKKIRQIALGQNHSVAIVGHGELWTWGLNTDSQLGYVLPPPARADEEPMSLVPRQVFGPLKKEFVLGVAASAVHSVAHTGTSLYCWGRNLGQLALMDADSRSLDVQQTPRRVAASLLSAPIEMVSAIDKATACLLSNHTVWVFTNYGYNLIRFPFPDVFANHNLSTNGDFSTRSDVGRKDICHIASGGDTIAALTARGDLFTMQLKGDNGVPAGSTTNPVKIKGAITQPQCIWQSRKDGVVSVSVGEHGSVVICTESGAVWKRVKRAKGKLLLSTSAPDEKRKDFKFQRIPYITDCVAVGSSTFGAISAIRKDSRVMTEQIVVSSQTLRDDLGSLLCLEDFFPIESLDAKDSSRILWEKAIKRETPGSVAHRILASTEIETDLLEWLRYNSSQYDVDVEIRTSTAPDIRIPVHGWILAGRSPTLRAALSSHHRGRRGASADTFTLEDANDRIVLTLLHVDIYTVLNVVVYAYQDSMIPVWNYTREAPSMAHRFRQARSEIMKVATKFHLPKLERAARLQVPLERSQDADFQAAIRDPMYWEDSDTILELDGGEMMAHSQLLCQRCPFFEGMFYGRSQGQWLAGRRELERIRIDMRHVRPEVFSYVRTFLYGDVGAELFDEVAVATLDDFSELVIEVLSVANELMIDRLAQICQMLIGKFVNTRNIANLLNEISPCAVSEFKDTGLEYICLQLESMLENHLLDCLDDELLRELDDKVRDNQLACLPVARSGRAELLLHDQYPDLLLDIEEERRLRVREIIFKAQREEERKASVPSKARFGALASESGRPLDAVEKGPRQPQAGQTDAPSPALHSKASRGEMMFSMEDEEGEEGEAPSAAAAAQGKTGARRSPQLELPEPLVALNMEEMPTLPEGWKRSKGKAKAEAALSPNCRSLSRSQSQALFKSPQTPIQTLDRPAEAPLAKPGSPWASSGMPTSKLDLKNIISEASSKSSLTAALAAQATKDAATKPPPRMSQKERKKQMQMQMEAQISHREEQAKAVPWETATSGKKQPAWKLAEPIARSSLQDALSADASQRNSAAAAAASLAPPNPRPLAVAESSSAQATQRRTASPDTRFPGQGRTHPPPSALATASSSSSIKQAGPPLVPHSKQYIQPAAKAETWLGASMADIIGQQRRERELVKEAVAKRSLQEIQQEQAFQEWWDQESRRTQEEEARRTEKAAAAARGGGRGGKRNRGPARGGAAKKLTETSAAGAATTTTSNKQPAQGTREASRPSAGDGPSRGRSSRGNTR